jgi:adenine deaminase
MNTNARVKGYIVDVLAKDTYPGCVYIENGKIACVERMPENKVPKQYIMPGFIDAHIHIESSMLVPSSFAEIAVQHGTVATVSDPHEIANVCGVDGVKYMIDNAKKVPLKFHFGAPSCVPATNFETAGAILDSEAIKELMADDDIYYLAEMMNFPGVLYDDAEVYKKIAFAKQYNKPVDGHAPGLRGDAAKKYIAAGISTDHECTQLEEALEKLQLGMKILIREGSAAKNFDALHPLFNTHANQLMFCSDDKHPDELLKGHINKLVARATAIGYDVYDLLYAACVHPITHYKLKVGQLRVGDMADFIIVNDLNSFDVLATFIDGNEVYSNGKVHFDKPAIHKINNFNCSYIKAAQLSLLALSEGITNNVKVIEAIDGELITNTVIKSVPVINGILEADLSQDVLKIVVVNRYKNATPAIGFITNFGLKKGAIASSVAHDSHNIVAVGVDEAAIVAAVNAVIKDGGGIAVFDGSDIAHLPLPIGGLMSDNSADEVGLAYEKLDKKAKALGSSLKAPFMSLSFMALPVIPQLKMTDKGLFDVNTFAFTSL